MAFDFSDFYIIYPGHPRFNDVQIIEDDVIRVIIQKWELMIFTNKGELFCDPEFGGDLPKYLHETRLSAETIESELRAQVREYINELESINYTLQVNFYEDPERYQEYMEINFQIADYEVYAVVT
jgi:phage baseplate assembly protein W